VGHLRRVDYLEWFQVHGFGAQVVEEAGSCAEQDRHGMDPHLVEQTGPDVLPGDVRAPHHHDILRCCGRLRLGEGALDPVDDEGVGRTTLLDDHLPGVMGNDHRLATSRCARFHRQSPDWDDRQYSPAGWLSTGPEFHGEAPLAVRTTHRARVIVVGELDAQVATVRKSDQQHGFGHPRMSG
jgi:hypothetical protein